MTQTVTTAEFLSNGGIKSVLIVDDGFDTVPQPNDLIGDPSPWVLFFGEIEKSDEDAIELFFPKYKELPESNLRKNEAFIAALWDAREKLREPLRQALFADYEEDLAQDNAHLATLQNELAAIDVVAETAGRQFEEQAKHADLIIIDLFLGAAQRPEDQDLSIEKLESVLELRRTAPPAVLLMSRRESLASTADYFREKTRSFASSFRFIEKKDLAKPGRLEVELTALAEHFPASRKLAAFIATWQSGLTDASSRAAADFRRLDLEDWAQIGDLLLKAENVTLGSYALDLFDQVLLHELESDKNIVKSAIPLNDLIGETYPPSSLVGRPHTLALAEKSLFQHKTRVKFETGRTSPVGFGDIIALKPGTTAAKNTIFYGAPETVFVVMTPACDLQRDKDAAKRIMLMAGQCSPAAPAAVNPIGSGPRTPIISMNDGRKMIVDWQLRHIETLSPLRISNLIEGKNCKAEIIGRLRETAAVSLQQRLLSHIGRVGTAAPPTASFPITVSISYINKDAEPIELPITADGPLKGICWVGRINDQKEVRVPFNRDWQLAFFDALEALDESEVHPSSRASINLARKIEVNHALFQRGLIIDPKSTGLQSPKLELSDGKKNFCKALFNRSVDKDLDKNALKKAGLIFQIIHEES